MNKLNYPDTIRELNVLEAKCGCSDHAGRAKVELIRTFIERIYKFEQAGEKTSSNMYYSTVNSYTPNITDENFRRFELYIRMRPEDGLAMLERTINETLNVKLSYLYRSMFAEYNAANTKLNQLSQLYNDMIDEFSKNFVQYRLRKLASDAWSYGFTNEEPVREKVSKDKDIMKAERQNKERPSLLKRFFRGEERVLTESTIKEF